jgi:hypothetical protein
MAIFGNSLEVTAARVLPRLADGPKTIDQLGVTVGMIKLLQRNGLVRPKMRPVRDAEGRLLGAVEMWTAAPTPLQIVERGTQLLDCAVLDFDAMGIS